MSLDLDLVYSSFGLLDLAFCLCLCDYFGFLTSIVISALQFGSYLILDLQIARATIMFIGTDFQPNQRQWIFQLFLCTNQSPLLEPYHQEGTLNPSD
jgi:hypothetical protein